MTRRSRVLAAESGFTLIEMMVSTAIMLCVLAGIFSVLNPAQGAFQAQPEVSDLQQRLRVAVDTLQKDLVMAGAGVYNGNNALQGALSNFFAPVMPYRTGALNPDPPGTYKSDTLSLLYVPEGAGQTTISDPMPPTSNELKVNDEPGCPSGNQLCGFKEGMHVIIFDGISMDAFTITNVQDSAGHLQRHGPDFDHSYAANSMITQAYTGTYYLKSNDATQTYQLMYYDGNQTDLPIVDNVVALNFQYFGDPQPPTLRKPVSDPMPPWTTYGPRPPALGVTADPDYPAGENCAFKVQGGMQVPRLADLTPGASALVALTPAMLTDGPWCPSPSSLARFDADLLRIRMVRITVRVQANQKMLRGTGALFAKAGGSKGGEMYVPDQEVHFDVTPRNLNLAR